MIIYQGLVAQIFFTRLVDTPFVGKYQSKLMVESESKDAYMIKKASTLVVNPPIVDTKIRNAKERNLVRNQNFLKVADGESLLQRRIVLYNGYVDSSFMMDEKNNNILTQL
jgi:hypothetical protein